MDIFTPNESFDFNKITLGNPQPSSGGSFFTKMTLNNKNIVLQLPKCVTKQSIADALRGKYCDLMYTNGADPELFSWIEQFETRCQDLIDSKKNLWFESDLTREDIETMMTPITRLFKSNKHVLIRTYLSSGKKDKTIAYDENEQLIDLDKVPSDKELIPLILFDGIRFSSRSFEVELKLVQVMIVEPSNEEPVQEQQPVCLIKKKSNLSQPPSTATTTSVAGTTSIAVPSSIEVTSCIALPTNISENTITTGENNINLVVNEKEYNETSSFSKKDESLAKEEIIVETIQPNIVDGMEEVNFNFDTITDSISLKKPNEVYYEIYKAAREKAKHMKKMAMEAYLEAKQIKTKYMLSDIEDDSDSDDSEQEQDSEIE